ncbi:MAG: hypothetical protein A2075_11580 [Geobacteraceae bacterium GWC2_58_44]|nr:MAG: hypothetical protein A2075_11580 [Geobacteraceae bacterium GWC2_58_44]HBG04809.1 hypothetical protein [Geobacter sp.]
MIFSVLSCISLVILGFSWFLYRRYLELFLCLLILINFEFFFVLPASVGYKYLLLPIVFVLLFEGLLTGKLAMGRYGWWIISFLAISVMGIAVAWSYGQGIALGIKAAKFIPLVLVYFLLAGRQINLEKFAWYFIAMSLLVAALASVCYLTHGAVNPFPAAPEHMLTEEPGKLRITIGQYVIAASSVMAFARFSNSSRLWYLFASAALFAEVIVVQQTRGFIAAIFASMFVVYVLSKKLTILRLSAYVVFTAFCFGLWLTLPELDLSGVDFVKRTRVDLHGRGGSYGGSLQARLNGYDLYWKQMQKAPVVGRGLQNFNWQGNQERNLQKYLGIHLSDIGIVHFLVQAGLVGFLWLLYGLLKLWKDLFRLRDHLVVACYFIIGTFTMPTLDMFLRVGDSLFLFAVFLGLTSSIIMTPNAAAVPKRS